MTTSARSSSWVLDTIFLMGILMCPMPTSTAHRFARGALCTEEATCPTRCNCTTSPQNLTVNCEGQKMDDLPKALPANTKVFLFANNKLAALSDNAFEGCNLWRLDLSSNFLKNLSEGAFRGIGQLQTLLLTNNLINFNTAPAKLLQFVPLLSDLSIHDNFKSDQTTRYNDQLFVPLQNLRNLTMDGLQNASFGPGFSSLEKLEHLTMFGDLRYITNDTFRILQNCSLKTFVVRSGVLLDVDALAFAHFKHLQVLDLGHNKHLGFQNVAKSWYGLNRTNISELVLKGISSSDYQIVNRTFFKYLAKTKLKKLVLDANNIIKIEVLLIFHTYYLEHLSIESNRLALTYDLMIDIIFLPFLTTLQASFQSRQMSLSGEYEEGGNLKPSSDNTANRLEQRTVQPAFNMTNLPILDREQLREHIPSLYTNLTQLRELPDENALLIDGVGYISKSTLVSANKVYILLPPRVRNFQVAASLTLLNYDTFPETIVFGINHLQTVNYSRNNVRNLVGPLIVETPPAFQLVLDFSENDCSILHPNFFQIGAFIGTLLFSHNNIGKQLSRDTNGTILRKLTEMTWFDLSSNNIKTLPEDVFKYQSKLQHLNLAGNSLRLVDFTFDHMTNLSFLDLSENLLDQLPLRTRTSLDLLASRTRKLTVDLTENPLQCSCDELEFLEWIFNSDIRLFNREMYTCTHKGRLRPFSELESDLLPELRSACLPKGWVIAIAVVFVGTILVLVASVVLYRHRFELRYLCLSLVIKRRKYQALENQYTEYDFDAFVAFDQCDRRWVDEKLVQQLDSKDGDGEFDLMLHHRDFFPGERIDENILRGIHNSRKIILVLSREFVESNWCDFELQMAQMRCFDEGKELIVPILLEENLPTLKLTRSLRSLLKRNTYLMWPEDTNELPNFWRNLKRALASKPDRVIRCQCGETMTV